MSLLKFLIDSGNDCSLTLDGTNYAYFPALNVSNDFVFEAKIRFDGATGDHQLCGQFYSSNQLDMGISSAGLIRFNYYDQLHTFGSVTYGVDYKLKITYSAGSVKFYIDDVFQNSFSKPALSSITSLGIGVVSDGLGGFAKNINGEVYWIKFIDNTDSTNSRTYILNSGSTTSEPSEEYPSDSAKDATYVSVTGGDWTC